MYERWRPLTLMFLLPAARGLLPQPADPAPVPGLGTAVDVAPGLGAVVGVVITGWAVVVGC